MRYHELITASGRRLLTPASLPYLAEITVPCDRWGQCTNLLYNDDVRIVEHELVADTECVVAHVACRTDEIRRLVEDGWA